MSERARDHVVAFAVGARHGEGLSSRRDYDFVDRDLSFVLRDDLKLIPVFNDIDGFEVRLNIAFIYVLNQRVSYIRRLIRHGKDPVVFLFFKRDLKLILHKGHHVLRSERRQRRLHEPRRFVVALHELGNRLPVGKITSAVTRQKKFPSALRPLLKQGKRRSVLLKKTRGEKPCSTASDNARNCFLQPLPLLRAFSV